MVTPEISSLEYTGGDETEQKRVRAMIRARGCRCRGRKTSTPGKRIKCARRRGKLSQKQYVNDAVETERVRRVQDEEGELVNSVVLAD